MMEERRERRNKSIRGGIEETRAIVEVVRGQVVGG